MTLKVNTLKPKWTNEWDVNFFYQNTPVGFQHKFSWNFSIGWNTSEISLDIMWTCVDFNILCVFLRYSWNSFSVYETTKRRVENTKKIIDFKYQKLVKNRIKGQDKLTV